MNKEILKDIIDWDIVNWSKSIEYWEGGFNFKNANFECLEIGGRKGGISLWLAMKGGNVICSDLESPKQYAYEVHKKYECSKSIQYKSIDATDIPYENYFDIVAFKSVLGGISRGGNNKLQQKVVAEIYKSLKVNGVLLFAENLEGSFLHKALRKKFVKWGSEWNYFNIEEVETIFASFKTVKFISVGFFGAFGRTEKQRTILGKVDYFFEKIVPEKMRYILIGIAIK